MAHQKLGNGQNTEQETDIAVVAPSNMGKGFGWDVTTNTYQVKLGKGLEFDNKGNIIPTSNNFQINTIDNGTGKIVHKQAVIDYGELIEVSGTILLPLAPINLLNKPNEDPDVVAERERLERLYPGCYISWVIEANGKAIGMFNHEQKLYQTETVFYLDYAQFGMAEVFSANATAGDILDFRKETAWIVNKITNSNGTIPIGIHVYYTEEQEECAVSYSIKGIKAK